MKKKSKRVRTSEVSRQQVDVPEGKRLSGNRGRPRKSLHVGADVVPGDSAGRDVNTSSGFSTPTADRAQKHLESKSKSTGRSSAALCRLCHGKFSPRSLRHAFIRPPHSLDAAEEPDTSSQSAVLFHADFQRLVGVQMDRDPSLSEFICKKCHAKFYKCHSILIRFLQTVNIPPAGRESLKSRRNATFPEFPVNPSLSTFSSEPKGLLSLVSWVHHHGEACRSCPGLKEVLESRCSVRAVWGCEDGHRYMMDTLSLRASCTASSAAVMSEEEETQQEDEDDEAEQSGGIKTERPAATGQTSSMLDDWTGSSEGHEDAVSTSLVQLDDGTADSDQSNRVISEEEDEERVKGGLSDEEFEPYADKRAHMENILNKRSPKSLEEPKARKKPGPKPGWKNKFKPKGEELPNIYKCPYQGCTAVYRAPDGLKKHIKEHHEEVRERPCPHPGCNKVFMIDRYLQRHVKLIHTEERNYICDQCGQTFKQRKHLSVHQMRHSGAKPLQCEVCGFQCRQRASLKYHMTKHKAEADLEFECVMCRKRFEKAHNLNVHMSMVHPLTQAVAQRGGGLHTITLTGEVVQQDQDR